MVMIYSNWLFKVHSGVKISSLYLCFQSQIAIEIFKKKSAFFYIILDQLS